MGVVIRRHEKRGDIPGSWWVGASVQDQLFQLRSYCSEEKEYRGGIRRECESEMGNLWW